ncbi:hypothetical protein [Algoriphagus limi]|uniref:Viral A-type inclusion protein n=1 Tax=Algoriphagus limi TaxID=2975273 RepID=A0ABT2GD34_9BACT|nr:hypothetical protein [Algoriphagus limi]MCS5491875.1 hypothetical protein [Algoriphagus limi]
MKRYTFIFTLLLISLLAACGSSLSEENKNLRADVIAVHDEVMPLMGKLKNLEREALNRAEELESNPEVDSVQVNELKSLAYDLSQAHEGMFVWMRQYDTEDGERTPEEVKAYLEEQMSMVQKVNEDIKAALARADELLGTE